jgi:hypothetical protein
MRKSDLERKVMFPVLAAATLALGGMGAWEVARALRTGEVSVRHDRVIARKDRPVAFWARTGLYAFGSVGLGIVGALGAVGG